MIPMTLIALAGTAVIALAALFIHHRASIQRRAANAAVEEEVQDKLKRAQASNHRMAQAILAGADMDAEIKSLTEDLSNIHALPTEKSWLWDSTDLGKWAKAQLALRVAAINQKARVWVLTILVGVALAVTAINAVIYSQLAAVPTVLSPYPPAKAQPVVAPLPVSGVPSGSASGVANPSPNP